MATGDIIPSGDQAVAWLVNPAGIHATTIDEDKGSPNTADFINAAQTAGMDGFIDDFQMSTLTVDNVSQIQVYAYGNVDASFGGNASVDLYNGTAFLGTWRPLSFPGGTPAWRSYTFTGLSMSQTNLNNCRVAFQANVAVSKSQVFIYTVYAIVTYTLTYAVGSPLGVIPANIGSVMGVLKANIASIKGV